MAVSQNGWPAVESSAGLVPLHWVTGRVVGGDVHTILDHLGARFNAEVEPITVPHSWGWAHRPVRGATVLSNHASGTAIDLNAPRHPLGAVGTFTPAQVAVIRDILRDVSPAVRWGGDYSGRKDEMHFEINTTPAQVAAVAARLRGGASGGGQSTAKPTTPTTSEEDEMNIFRAAGYGIGVLQSQGAWSQLRSEEEKKNLLAAGAREIWIEKATLDALIKDQRGQYTTVGIR